MTDNIEEASKLSNEVLQGLETGTLPISAACLLCLRIARLLNDHDSVEWLEYESMGYPTTFDGHIESKAFELGCEHGRENPSKDGSGRQGFFRLADELESGIKVDTASLNNLTTQGLSLSGDMIASTLRDFTFQVNLRTGSLSNNIMNANRYLSTLRGQYYRYALKVNIELKFSQDAEDIFRSYRLSTDTHLLKYAPESIRRLDAAYINLKSDNPESWSQALTSCRRVFQELSDNLFDSFIPGKRNEEYFTQSGKALNVTGDNYKNRLYAIIDMLSKSKTGRRIIGSEVIYFVDWIECFHDLLSKGVHEIETPISYEEARSGVIHTYMLMGDISSILDTPLLE